MTTTTLPKEREAARRVAGGGVKRKSKPRRRYKLNWKQIVDRLEAVRKQLKTCGTEIPVFDEALHALRERLGMPTNT